jgi:hypothetical protein
MLSWYPNSTLHCMRLMQPFRYQHKKISPIVVPPFNIKIIPNTVLPRLMSKFKIPVNAVRPCSTPHQSTVSTSERLTFSSTCFCQKDERALPENYMAENLSFFLVECSISDYSPSTFSSLSLTDHSASKG